jgi:pimeloyl-ACP methyl ester carboxylesterase
MAFLPLDSWHIWHSLLGSAKLTDNAVLVAVDLPGYGGSDSLPNYHADSVMELMSEFVLKMRSQYVARGPRPTRGPVIIAAHDWGAIVAFRLASEAPTIADRFILSNSFHVGAPHIYMTCIHLLAVSLLIISRCSLL